MRWRVGAERVAVPACACCAVWWWWCLCGLGPRDEAQPLCPVHAALRRWGRWSEQAIVVGGGYVRGGSWLRRYCLPGNVARVLACRSATDVSCATCQLSSQAGCGPCPSPVWAYVSRIGTEGWVAPHVAAETGSWSTCATRESCSHMHRPQLRCPGMRQVRCLSHSIDDP